MCGSPLVKTPGVVVLEYDHPDLHRVLMAAFRITFTLEPGDPLHREESDSQVSHQGVVAREYGRRHRN